MAGKSGFSDPGQEHGLLPVSESTEVDLWDKSGNQLSQSLGFISLLGD